MPPRIMHMAGALLYCSLRLHTQAMTGGRHCICLSPSYWLTSGAAHRSHAEAGGLGGCPLLCIPAWPHFLCGDFNACIHQQRSETVWGLTAGKVCFRCGHTAAGKQLDDLCKTQNLVFLSGCSVAQQAQCAGGIEKVALQLLLVLQQWTTLPHCMHSLPWSAMTGRSANALGLPCTVCGRSRLASSAPHSKQGIPPHHA
jgi:hypothetical protein